MCIIQGWWTEVGLRAKLSKKGSSKEVYCCKKLTSVSKRAVLSSKEFGHCPPMDPTTLIYCIISTLQFVKNCNCSVTLFGAIVLGFKVMEPFLGNFYQHFLVLSRYLNSSLQKVIISVVSILLLVVETLSYIE